MEARYGDRTGPAGLDTEVIPMTELNLHVNHATLTSTKFRREEVAF